MIQTNTRRVLPQLLHSVSKLTHSPILAPPGLHVVATHPRLVHVALRGGWQLSLLRRGYRSRWSAWLCVFSLRLDALSLLLHPPVHEIVVVGVLSLYPVVVHCIRVIWGIAHGGKENCLSLCIVLGSWILLAAR